MRTRFRIAVLLGASLAGIAAARAQLSSLAAPAAPAGSQNAPVTFLADEVTYDKPHNLVIATGHVRAWQNGQTLYADKLVIDRNADTATATGHVILTQATGESVFADQAVLSHQMKDAVMTAVAARLAENGRIIANGAERYGGKIDEMTKVVYSACDLCATDPSAAPLWQIRATSATRDLEHKMIEYRDATMEIHGIPVFYLPYMTQPDPSVKRQTGLLIPSLGVSSRLGFFVAVPYYIVIDRTSDVTITPIIAAKTGPAVDAKYRKDFNNGVLHIDASAGQDDHSLGNSVFSDGQFNLNPQWRVGFNYNHASNPAYLNDFRILPNASFLTSSLYAEGFAPGAYARLDGELYQGLVASVNQSKLPIVAPHGQYAFLSDPDPFGGRFSLQADAFNVLRNQGTNTRRLAAISGYSLPFAGPLGQRWTARVELVTAAYEATRLYNQPNYSTLDGADTGRVQPYGALYMAWPFLRPAGRWGNQILEPEAQIVAAPQIGSRQNYRIPNEDSLDLEFSDANLFDFNRYPGIDRLEGGTRVDYALHAAWYLPHNAMLDGLFGQSYRFHKDTDYLPDSGLTDNVSDYVGRITLAPSPLFNLTYRTRLSHSDLGARMIDATASAGPPALNLTGGYLYTTTNPYVLYDQPGPPTAAYFTPRHEATANIATAYGAWSLSAGTERNLQTGQFDEASFNAGWQNNCAAVNVMFYQRYTSFNLDHGDTTLLVQFTFKTLGNVGFNAL